MFAARDLWRRVTGGHRRPLAPGVALSRYEGPLWNYPNAPTPLAVEARHIPEATALCPTPSGESSFRIVVDGTCFQDSNYATRGIGRFGSAVVNRVVQSWPPGSFDVRVAIDPTQPSPTFTLDHPFDTATVEQIHWSSVALYFQPSPMTHSVSAANLAAIEHDVWRVGLLHDFIPQHTPDVYLPTEADRHDYQERLEALANYHELWTNSHTVRHEATRLLHRRNVFAVPLPEHLSVTDTEAVPGVNPVFVFAPLGADRRKNIPGAVATLAALSNSGYQGTLVVLSHMPDAHRLELNVFAQSMGLDHDRLVVVSELSDPQIAWLYANAAATLMCSFDEGLSMPIIESLEHGCPVVASNIAVHRELLGATPAWLVDPRDPEGFAERLLDTIANRSAHVIQQQQQLASRVPASSHPLWEQRSNV